MALPDTGSSRGTKIPSPRLQAVLYILGFAACLVAFWPGFMSQDSLDQYAQAKRGVYHDWHPPIMSFVWSWLLLFADGPQPMLVLQAASVWLALGLLARRFSSSPYATWIFFLVGLLPWIANFEGVIWKDVGLAASWLLAAALIGLGPQQGILLVATGTLLFYGITVRHNAIFGAPPLVFLFLRHGAGLTSSNLRVLVYALALSLGLVAVGSLVNASIGAQHVYPISQVMIDDLHSMSVKTGRNLFPPAVGIDATLIEKCHDKRTSLVWCYQSAGWAHGATAGVVGPFRGFLSGDEYVELRGRWLQTVMREPTGYLRTRLASFRALMRGSDPPFYYWQPGTTMNDLAITQTPNMLTRALEATVRLTATRMPILLKPYFWTLLALILLVVATFKKDSDGRPLVLALLSSAVLYTFAYLPITATLDFRLVYWPVVATNAALAILLVGWRHAGGRTPAGREERSMSSEARHRSRPSRSV